MPAKESVFFMNLKKVIGNQYVKSKWLGKTVKKSDIFLDKDYRSYIFTEEINNTFVAILRDLLSNEQIPKGSISDKIDGMIVNHPALGTRIVEFDEEQHFTPFRRETLKYLSETIFKRVFLQHCCDITCYNRMLKKHGVKILQERIPDSTVKFQSFIEQYAKDHLKGKEESRLAGYIKPVPGFRLWGGRIAQRAYYDTLRDYAHLSSKNSGFVQSIRVSQFEIENCYNKKFNKISDNELQEYIKHKLSQLEL